MAEMAISLKLTYKFNAISSKSPTSVSDLDEKTLECIWTSKWPKVATPISRKNKGGFRN